MKAKIRVTMFARNDQTGRKWCCDIQGSVNVPIMPLKGEKVTIQTDEMKRNQDWADFEIVSAQWELDAQVMVPVIRLDDWCIGNIEDWEGLGKTASRSKPTDENMSFWLVQTAEASKNIFRDTKVGDVEILES